MDRVLRGLAGKFLLRGTVPLILFGGYLNRWRGDGGWPHSGTFKRVIVGVITALWAVLWFGDSWWALPFILLLWAGFAPGWGSYMDMGRNPKPDNEFLKPVLDLFFEDKGFWRDFTGMTLRGIVLTGLPSIALGFWIGWPALLFAVGGAGMGPLYALAYKLPKTKIANPGPEWGEVLFGTWLWLLIAVIA